MVMPSRSGVGRPQTTSRAVCAPGSLRSLLVTHRDEIESRLQVLLRGQSCGPELLSIQVTKEIQTMFKAQYWAAGRALLY